MAHSHLVLGLGLGSVLIASFGCQAPETEPRSAVVQHALNEALETSDHVRVIINLGRIERDLAERDQQLAISKAQRTILEHAGNGFRLIHQFRHVPAMAGVLSREALEAIKRLNDVDYVQLDDTGSGALAEAVPLTGADRVQSTLGIRGKGVRVAVLDSGASTTHPAIADSLVGQHCFTSAACPPNDTDEGTSAEDDEDHGSNVTGVITSNGTGGISPGYAPDSEIVAVKVLDRDGRGWVSDWVSGLEWVYDNLTTLKVHVVNMSLDTDATYTTQAACDTAQPAMASAAAKLTSSGVTLFASSGNAGSTNSMSAPACNTGFIAVGATYDSNLGRQPSTTTSYQTLFGSPWPDCFDATATPTTVTCFTNTGGTRLDLLAPGALITSAGDGTTNTTYRGTSQASPAAAGIAALMLECNPSLTPARVAEILKTTGRSVTDTRTGNVYPMVRAEDAVKAACGNGSTSTGGTSASTGGTQAASGGAQSSTAPSAGGTQTASGGAQSSTATSTGGTKTAFGGQSSSVLSTGGTQVTSGGRFNTAPSAGGTETAFGGQSSSVLSAGGTQVTSGGKSSSAVHTGGLMTGGAQSTSGSRETATAVTGGVGSSLETVAADSNQSEVKASCSCRTGNTRATTSMFANGWYLLLLSGLLRRKASCQAAVTTSKNQDP